METHGSASNLISPFEAIIFSQTLPSLRELTRYSPDARPDHPIEPTRNRLKRGQEYRDDITRLPLPPPHLNMSTEREIAEKFKEAMEMRNVDLIVPYLAWDLTWDILPYTSAVVPPGGTPQVLSVMIQGREEADKG